MNKLASGQLTAEDLRGEGGFMDVVFREFGFENATRYKINSLDAENILNNSDKWENFVLGGGTKGSSDTIMLNKELDIAGRHAYSIKPQVNNNGDIVFEITNPWHTSQHTIISKDELKKYFNNLFVAELK